MELFLTSEEAAIGDITALQAQLLESDVSIMCHFCYTVSLISD